MPEVSEIPNPYKSETLNSYFEYAGTWLSLSVALPEVSFAMQPSAMAVMKRLTGKCAVKFAASPNFSPAQSAL